MSDHEMVTQSMQSDRAISAVPRFLDPSSSFCLYFAVKNTFPEFNGLVESL